MEKNHQNPSFLLQNEHFRSIIIQAVNFWEKFNLGTLAMQFSKYLNLRFLRYACTMKASHCKLILLQITIGFHYLSEELYYTCKMLIESFHFSSFSNHFIPFKWIYGHCRWHWLSANANFTTGWTWHFWYLRSLVCNAKTLHNANGLDVEWRFRFRYNPCHLVNLHAKKTLYPQLSPL